MLEFPLLFKHMEDNFIYLKQQKVTLEQARAIKEILIQASSEKDPTKNAFVIKSIVIDDCSMKDEVFA